MNTRKIIFVVFFYAYETGIGKTAVSQTSIDFFNFQITGFSKSLNNTCYFNFSFTSSSNNFNNFPLILQLNTYTGLTYNDTVNSTNYNITAYPSTGGEYTYAYNAIKYNLNSTVCGIFTTYQTSTSGYINGIIINSGGKNKLASLNPQISTVYK